MKLSRFTSAPRLVWTTLLLTSLSLALSPELFAEDPLAQSSQSPIEASAHQSEDSFAEFVTKRWEDEDEEDEIVPIQRKKRREDLRGPRFGFCVGLDFTCVLGGFKTGYSWERGTLLVQLPFLDVEGSLFLWTFERSDGRLMRPYVSADLNFVAMVNFGGGVEFVGPSRRWVVRPQIAFSPEDLGGLPFPLGSLSFLLMR